MPFEGRSGRETARFYAGELVHFYLGIRAKQTIAIPVSPN